MRILFLQKDFLICCYLYFLLFYNIFCSFSKMFFPFPERQLFNASCSQRHTQQNTTHNQVNTPCKAMCSLKSQTHPDTSAASMSCEYMHNGKMSQSRYPATRCPKVKASDQLWANTSVAEGAEVNKHCTFLNSHFTFPDDEQNLGDLNDDCMYPALPLANNAAHDPVTALTICSQFESCSKSQRLT